MKKFQFRLQTVLKIRQQEQDQKKRRVGSLISQINEHQRQALEMAEDADEQGRILQQYIKGSVNVNWVANYHRYVSYLQQAIAGKIDAVTQVQKQLHQARQDLAEAAKQTKVLEKLKEKLNNRYQSRLNKLQHQQTDEIGTNIFLRSRNLH